MTLCANDRTKYCQCQPSEGVHCVYPMTTTPQTEAMRLADAISEGMREWFDGTARFLMTMQRGKAIVDELRRLDAECEQLRYAVDTLLCTDVHAAGLEQEKEILDLKAERDQLRTQVERLQSQPAAWECFLDPSYFDMWAVKRKDSRSFQDAFHVTSEVEAQRLCGLLNGIRQPAAPAMVALTDAARDVLAERQRQISEEGWTTDHDDHEHLPGELALAAASYVCADEDDPPPAIWPWDCGWWKPKDRRRNLVRAGALILAEIELTDRAHGIGQPAGGEEQT